MSAHSKLEKYGAVVSLDWRPGEPVCCEHPANAPVADILLLQTIGQPPQVIYADKKFGRCIEQHGLWQTWEYPLTLAMSISEATKFLSLKCNTHSTVFSKYTKKIKVNPSLLLDAAVHQDVSKIGIVTMPEPVATLKLLSTDCNWAQQQGKWQNKNWENVSILLHNPKIVHMEMGTVILENRYIHEACLRLAKKFLANLCMSSGKLLREQTDWPSRAIENLVKAKFKRAKHHHAVRKMPPCVEAALKSTDVLNYQLRFQLAEVFSYSSIALLNRHLEPRLETDGKHRHTNIRACYHAAKKKRADQRPCVTRTGTTGLYCVYGGGSSGVKQCAQEQGFKGNTETVTVSQMWGLQPS